MFQQPRLWRGLKRHPLSARYEDIKGRTWERYKENIKERGILNERKVMMYEGMVIDGWQLQRACVETDIKPTYKELKLPKNTTAEEWVETVNDLRRHESQELVMQRADERRERVAAARAEGQSTRAIAETEGVSPKTIRNDLEAITGEGTQCEPPDGKVTGQDGRQQPATRFILPTGEAKPTIFCSRCQRVSPVKDCAACKIARREAREGREPGDDTQSEAEARQRKGKEKDTNGEELFTLQAFHMHCGKALYELDKLAREYGQTRKSGKVEVISSIEHTGIVRQFKEAIRQTENWNKALKKQAARNKE